MAILGKEKTASLSPHQLNAITDEIIKSMEKGRPPWVMPWSGTDRTLIMGAKRYTINDIPKNIGSPDKSYSLPFNMMILNMIRNSRGFETNFWITPERIGNLDAKPKSGESPAFVISMFAASVLIPKFVPL